MLEGREVLLFGSTEATINHSDTIWTGLADQFQK